MNDKIIYFPGWEPKVASQESENSDNDDVILDILDFDEGPEFAPEQQKALNILNSGVSFVMIGIKPTDTGADFFNAIYFKDKSDISNCIDFLPNIINKACSKKGIFPSSPNRGA